VVSKRVLLQNKSIAASVGEKSKSPDEYLQNGWFPANTDFVKTILARLKAGEFQDNRKLLVEEIKKDLSLLASIIKDIPASDDFVENPIRIIEVAPLDLIAKGLQSVIEVGSSHSLSATLKPQAMRIRQSMISCSTSELIAARKGIDPNLAYSVAMIRQVGLALVAWNYPRIYAKALSQLSTSEEDLETILHRGLGFSPRQMGVGLVIGAPSADMKIALGFDDPVGDSVGKTLREISELAEIFAQANDPEHFPAATRQWSSIEGQITSILGPDGLPIIRERVKRFGVTYGTMPMVGVDQDISKERNLEIANRKHVDNLITQNLSGQKLSDDLQLMLRKVYSLMRVNEVSPEALQILVMEFIPAAGFSRGCVFLQDPNSQNLIPKLRIGDRAIEEYRQYSKAKGSSGDNPILEALQSTVPVKRDGAVLFGERVSMVSGVIGSGEKGGVLYLEMDANLADSGGFEPVLRFKAIRHCLNQCLNLKNAFYQ
jgi:hypothetical protein